MLSGRIVAGGLAIILFASAAIYGGYRVARHFAPVAAAPAPHTAVVVTGPPSSAPVVAATPTPTATPLPTSVFVTVPYTSQSPFGQWGAGNVHEEYCEAAALLMVSDYLKGDKRSKIPAAEADSAMAQIVNTERKDFPGVMDLPLNDISQVGGQMFGLKAAIVPVDQAQIEANLANGQPVIIPVMTHGAAGQKISPYYGSVNVYHVIVLTGYDTSKGLLYTNDAGFMQGQNYAYSWSTLSSAIDAQASKQGRVMLTFSPS